MRTNVTLYRVKATSLGAKLWSTVAYKVTAGFIYTDGLSPVTDFKRTFPGRALGGCIFETPKEAWEDFKKDEELRQGHLLEDLEEVKTNIEAAEVALSKKVEP